MQAIMNTPLPACAHISECLAYFSMLFDHIRMGVSITDEDGRIIYYNKALSMIDNISVETALGRHMCEVYDFTPESSPALRVLRTGIAIVDSVNSYRTRSGYLVNASCAIYPLRITPEAVAGVICFSQNYSWLDLQVQNVRQELLTEHEPDDAAPAAANSPHYSFTSLVGHAEKLRKATSMAKMAAKTDSTVMLVGETGVGKEIYAQSIHYGGGRKRNPYTAINCSAVPETLLEGILFGTVKGAFTGAMNKPGLFEVSNKGTLFLDEVDSMPVSLQSKLLRALQDKRVRRVGDASERPVDVRIISSVGREPMTLMQLGLLRPDFYYRLGVVKIHIPPLRERKDDIPELALHFVRKFAAKRHSKKPRITDAAMQLLCAHAWPGNVRELEHCIEAVFAILRHDADITSEHLMNACPEILDNRPLGEVAIKSLLPPMPWSYAAQDSFASEEERPGSTGAPLPSAYTAERAEPAPPAGSAATEEADPAQDRLHAARHKAEIGTIRTALQRSAGNQSMAARLLGISPQLLHYKLKKFHISVKDFLPHSM